MRFLALTCLSACALAASFAADTWRVPRTPDGHPDLQGIWTNSTMTPLERSSEFAGKPYLSPQEAAAYENRVVNARNRDRRDGDPETDVARAYNELFFDQGSKLAAIDGQIRTSLVVDPPDGRVPPLTPTAAKAQQQAREYARQHPADGPEDRSLTERCLWWPTAGPPMLPGPYNNTYQIVQTPGYVMIMVEMIHDVRIIPLDGRPHLPKNVGLWLGDSRGHWEEDTLVVDTTNFGPNTRIRGSDQNLHLIERFRRVDQDTIRYEFTVDDPTAFTKAWTAVLPFKATTGPIYEYACHEGNYALVDILSGARAQEGNKVH